MTISDTALVAIAAENERLHALVVRLEALATRLEAKVTLYGRRMDALQKQNEDYRNRLAASVLTPEGLAVFNSVKPEAK